MCRILFFGFLVHNWVGWNIGKGALGLSQAFHVRGSNGTLDTVIGGERCPPCKVKRTIRFNDMLQRRESILRRYKLLDGLSNGICFGFAFESKVVWVEVAMIPRPPERYFGC